MRNRSFIPCVAALASVAILASPVYAQQKTAKACEAEWRSNKASIQASGKKKKDFITECRAGTGQTAATTAPASPPSAATPAPSTANAAKGEERPALHRGKRAGAVISTGAGQYATETEAKAHCPGDTVVWANTRSKIYHFSPYGPYGKTRAGAYMCEKDTAAAGIRSAKNEKRP